MLTRPALNLPFLFLQCAYYKRVIVAYYARVIIVYAAHEIAVFDTLHTRRESAPSTTLDDGRRSQQNVAPVT